MRSRHTRSFAAVCSLAILFCTTVFASQKDDKNSTVPVTVTVTVLGINDTPAPEIPQQDVTVH